MELKTIKKALMVFNCFAKGESSVGTVELAARLNTNKATMSRVLSTLKKYDYLEQDPRTRRYRLGGAMVEMARAVYRNLDGMVATIANPFADELRDTTGERVHIEVIAGNNIYLSYVADTPNPISLKIDRGDQVMPHAHSGAKAIVAFSQPGVIEQWLTRKLPLYTKNTVDDVDHLKKLYEEIRKTGIAYDFGEYFDEVNTIGAPIFNHTNEPVAGIILVVPSYRMKKKWNNNHIALLKKTANTISSKLHSLRKI